MRPSRPPTGGTRSTPSSRRSPSRSPCCPPPGAPTPSTGSSRSSPSRSDFRGGTELLLGLLPRPGDREVALQERPDLAGTLLRADLREAAVVQAEEVPGAVLQQPAHEPETLVRRRVDVEHLGVRVLHRPAGEQRVV